MKAFIALPAALGAALALLQTGDPAPERNDPFERSDTCATSSSSL